MDRRMTGKWYKEEFGETLNIFDETPLRMKISFSSTGFYNFEPNCVYEKDGCLCFEINDEYNRMVYHLAYEDGQLKGFYSRFGKNTGVRYEKVSDIPEDLPYKYLPFEVYLPGSETPRIDVLKQYAAYDEKAYDCDSEFVLGGNAPEILNKYRYSEYVNGLDSTSDEIVFRLLDFVCDHFGHNGTNGMGKGGSVTDLITFCESNEMKMNCRGLAILLASLLRLNGIKARHITCMPYEDPFDDCHVVVDCLLPSGDRIMLDPSWRLYFKDECGKYVSLPHLRELLIADKPIFANQDASYNGGSFDPEFYRNYMIKNTLRFGRWTLHKDCIDSSVQGSRYIELIPRDYPTGNFSEQSRKCFVYNDKDFWKI